MNELRNQKTGFRKVTSQPEFLTFIIMIGVLLILLVASEGFRDVGYIVKAASRYVEFGIAALAMTFVIIAGMIDLSVASTMALCATMTGWAFHNWGFPMGAAAVFGLALGCGTGFLNGILIAKGKIQPMIVTIGTMSLYRGIAQSLIGDSSLSKFPEWFNQADRQYLFEAGTTKFPWTLLLFIIIAVIMLLILKYTSTGRKVYAIGTSEKAAAYSGVNIDKFKITIMVLSGLFAAIGGLLTMSRLLVVRYDMHSGGELEVITMVILGGTSINGGRGTIFGTILGWITIVFVKSGMGVAGIEAELQTFIMGALLLASILVPQVTDMYKERKMQKIAQMAHNKT